MKKTRDFILTFLIVGSLAVFGILFLVLPKDSDVSEEENRILASAPGLSEITGAGFREDLAAYLADRFPMRNTFVRAKAYSELALGKRENNGVVFASDGYLVSRAKTDAASCAVAAEKAASTVGICENAAAPVYFFLTGRTADIESARLPSVYDGSGDAALHKAVFDAISASADTTDLTETLKSAAERGEFVSYRTDHHWTVYGAEYAYKAIVEKLGYTPRTFTFTDAADGFYGTTYSASGLVSFGGDTIAFAGFDGMDCFALTAYSRSEDGYSGRDIGFYDTSALSAKDKYKAYLYGNFAEVTVRKTTEERQKLLIIKDSYFNCVAPMLAADFDLDVIDPRYMREEDVRARLLDPGYAAIIMLFGVGTFTE